MTRDLLEGFEASAEPLPDLIARQITSREQALAEQIAKLGISMGDAFSTRFGERMGMAARIYEDLQSKASDFDTSVDLRAAAGIGGGGAGQTNALAAVESRLLTRGESTDVNKQIAANTKMAVEEQKGTRREIQELNRSLRNQDVGQGRGGVLVA